MSGENDRVARANKILAGVFSDPSLALPAPAPAPEALPMFVPKRTKPLPPPRKQPARTRVPAPAPASRRGRRGRTEAESEEEEESEEESEEDEDEEGEDDEEDDDEDEEGEEGEEGDDEESEEGEEGDDEDGDDGDEESEEGEDGYEGVSGTAPLEYDSDDTLLHISEELALPSGTVTESIGIVAQRGSGKTYLTAVLAEEMSAAQLPFVILDPMGVYWGLRSSADGQEEGFRVMILGGQYGDIPLDPSSGRAVARWILTYRERTVLDLSELRKADQRLFVADFAEELFESCKDPLHIIVDEADLFIPQKPAPEDKRCLMAFEDIVRRGRSRGLGITVVTQRPAVIHKDIFTQIGTLIVLRMMGPQDRKAIEEWVRSHGDIQKQRMMIASLASLPIGTAWVWSPGWLGILRRVAIRTKLTWDSSVTPVVGAPRVLPDARAPVDLDTLRASLIRAAEYDPNSTAALKARIKELENALNEKEGSGGTVTRLQKRVTQLEKQLMTRPVSVVPPLDGDAVIASLNSLTMTVSELIKKVGK